MRKWLWLSGVVISFAVISLLAMAVNHVGLFSAFDEEKDGLIRIHALKEEPFFSADAAGEVTVEWLQEEMWLVAAEGLRCRETMAFPHETKPCFETDETHGTASIRDMETEIWVPPDKKWLPVLRQMETENLLMWACQLFLVQGEKFVSVLSFGYSSIYYYHAEEDRLIPLCHLSWAQPVGLEVVSVQGLKKLK